MQFAIWIGVCACLVVISGRRTQIPVIAVTALWLVIPWNASAFLTGVPPEGLGPIPGMHPGTWLVLVILVLRLLTRDAGLAVVFRERSALIVLMVMVIIFIVVTTAAQMGLQGIASVIYLLLVPFAYSLLLLAEFQRNRKFAESMRTVLLGIASLQSLLGLSQYFLGQPVFFSSYYESEYWWGDDLSRAIGTMDHPLMLGLLVAVAVPLTAGVKSPVLRGLLPFLFLAASMTTGSRVGLVVVVIGIVWLVLAAPIGPFTRFSMLGILGFGMLMLYYGVIFESAFDRFGDDSGSVRVRTLAYELFFQVWHNYIFIGGGASHSYSILAEAGLTTSFESAPLTYVLDYGLILTLVIFAILFTLAWQRPNLNLNRGPKGSAGSTRESTLSIADKKSTSTRKRYANRVVALNNDAAAPRRKVVKPGTAVLAGSSIALVAAFGVFSSYSGGSLQSSAAPLLWITAALAGMRHKPSKHSHLELSETSKINLR